MILISRFYRFYSFYSLTPKDIFFNPEKNKPYRYSVNSIKSVNTKVTSPNTVIFGHSLLKANTRSAIACPALQPLTALA